MPYTPLVLDHVPAPLRNFVDDTVEKYLRELHYLLAVPIPTKAGPQHFQISIANMLLAVISGTASTLTTFDPPSGTQFIKALLQYYPWDRDMPVDGTPKDASHILYRVFRNPIVHTGFALRGGRTVKTGRGIYPLDAIGIEREVERIETSAVRPFVKRSIVIEPDKIVLWLDPLYWGVRQMIQRALAEASQCEAVWTRIQSGKALLSG